MLFLALSTYKRSSIHILDVIHRLPKALHMNPQTTANTNKCTTFSILLASWTLPILGHDSYC